MEKTAASLVATVRTVNNVITLMGLVRMDVKKDTRA